MKYCVKTNGSYITVVKNFAQRYTCFPTTRIILHKIHILWTQIYVTDYNCIPNVTQCYCVVYAVNIAVTGEKHRLETRSGNEIIHEMENIISH
jgi:hypothetical protein